MGQDNYPGEKVATDESWDTKQNVALGVVGVAVIVVLLFLISNLLLASTFADWKLTILSGIASSLLSLALILIYYRMSQTQLYMSSLQKEETKITRTSNAPQISVDEIRYTGNGNLFHLTLSNLGKGSAQDLELSLDSKLYYWDGDAFELKSVDGWELYHDDVPLTKQLEEQEGTPLTSQGNYIEKGRVKEVFEFELNFSEITNGRVNHERDTPSITPGEVLKTAILEKTVDQDHEHAAEFNRFENRMEWKSEVVHHGGKDYSADTLQTLSNDIEFNRLCLTFKLNYTDEMEETTSEDIAEIVVPLTVDLDDNQMWEFSYPWSEYQSQSKHYSDNMGMDPIEEAIRRAEFDSSQHGAF